MKLYELTEQYRDLQKMEDMDPDAIADTLEAVGGEFENKAQAIVTVSRGMDANIEAIDNEIKRLNDLKKSIKNREDSLRDYLRENMAAAGISNIKCPLFSITLAKGREVAVIHDESELPDEYMSVKTTITPDKKAILAALKAGTDVPGAALERSAESLRVK